MLRTGNATIFVSDLDAAVGFYTDTLGLKLRYQVEQWADVDAGGGFTIGLHPASEKNPAGRRGSISVGLIVSEPIADVVRTLTDRGVVFHGDIVDDGAVKLAFFGDPDGNDLYLCEVPSGA